MEAHTRTHGHTHKTQTPHTTCSTHIAHQHLLNVLGRHIRLFKRPGVQRVSLRARASRCTADGLHRPGGLCWRTLARLQKTERDIPLDCSSAQLRRLDGGQRASKAAPANRTASITEEQSRSAANNTAPLAQARPGTEACRSVRLQSGLLRAPAACGGRRDHTGGWGGASKPANWGANGADDDGLAHGICSQVAHSAPSAHTRARCTCTSHPRRRPGHGSPHCADSVPSDWTHRTGTGSCIY
jgi:hypothetical protein